MHYDPNEIPNKIMFGGECKESVCFKPCKKCEDKQSPEVQALKLKVAELEKQLEIFTKPLQVVDITHF